MSYSEGSYKEASLPQIQYSQIQNTERDFKVKSGDEVNTDKQKKQYAEPQLHQPQENIENNQIRENKCCCLKYGSIIACILVMVLIMGTIIYFLFPKSSPISPLPSIPTIPFTPKQLPSPSIIPPEKTQPIIINEPITPINVAIMGTNDLNGKVYPTKLYRSDTKQSYNYGGLATLLTLRNIVAKQYNGNFLYLDAGDSVVGGIQTSSFVSSGQIMNDFFKSANLTAFTFGDHQINWGTGFILSYLKGRQTPNLAANLKPIPNQWIPNQKNSMISHLQNGIKVGLIGINAEVARESKSKDIFQFDNDYVKIVLNQSKELKSQGANAIVLIAHMENKCENNFSYGNWTNQSNSPMCP